MTKAYVTETGLYLFSFDGDIAAPEGAIEVPSAPDAARQVWDFGAGEWLAASPDLADYEAAIQAHVDATARTKLFRDGVTMASYAASTNVAWAAEASAFIAWRDAVWTHAYAELAKVQAGTRAQPGLAEFVAELPAITWPD